MLLHFCDAKVASLAQQPSDALATRDYASRHAPLTAGVVVVNVNGIRRHEVERLVARAAEVLLLPPEFQIACLSETVIPEHHPQPRRSDLIFTPSHPVFPFKNCAA